MYAAKGASIAEQRVTSRVVSKWGGEDGELLKKIKGSGAYRIVHEQEPGLIHKWHEKKCTPNEVDHEFRSKCNHVKYDNSGSHFMRTLRLEEPDFFDYLVFQPASAENRSLAEAKRWIKGERQRFEKNPKNP